MHPADTVKYQCPHCTKWLRISSKFSGKCVPCPNPVCKQPIDIPKQHNEASENPNAQHQTLIESSRHTQPPSSTNTSSSSKRRKLLVLILALSTCLVACVSSLIVFLTSKPNSVIGSLEPIQIENDAIALSTELQQFGYDSVTQHNIEKYLRFGRADSARRVINGDLPAVQQAEKEASEHRTIAKDKLYSLSYLWIYVPYSKNNAQQKTVVQCGLPLQIHLPIVSKRRNSQSLTSLSVNWAASRRSWLLTNDGALKPLKPEAALVAESTGGSIYFPDDPVSELIFFLNTTDAEFVTLFSNQSKLQLFVTISNLRYAEPAEFGFYSKKDLAKFDWDSPSLIAHNRNQEAHNKISSYIRLTGNKPNYVQADLRSARIADKDGKTIASIVITP